MEKGLDSYKKIFEAALDSPEGVEALKREFVGALPPGLPGDQMFNDATAVFAAEELPVVCAELAATLSASCTEDDFHNWNYDHLELIIDLSNRYGFSIPRNLLNGLPEQLILLVDKDKLDTPDCE